MNQKTFFLFYITLFKIINAEIQKVEWIEKGE
jgi:hypothetical protein